jgi:uncharacterized protein (TIGR02246 family)
VPTLPHQAPRGDEHAIRQLMATWMAATRDGDTDRLLSLMTDDALFLTGARPPMGKADFAAAARAQAGPGAPRIDGRSDIQELRVLGDWAYLWSRLSVTVTPDGATPAERAGPVLTLLRKERGQWRLSRDANMLSPVQPPQHGHELTTARFIDAPCEQVFGAFSDPSRLARWWGPRGFTNTFEAFDLRPGGDWHFVMHGPDGKDYPNTSVFTEVQAPHRVAFRHTCAPLFKMTISFTAHGDKTLVGWQQVFESEAACSAIAKYAVAANEQNLDRLAAEVAAGRRETGAQ